jgi:hypothetical protein
MCRVYWKLYLRQKRESVTYFKKEKVEIKLENAVELIKIWLNEDYLNSLSLGFLT